MSIQLSIGLEQTRADERNEGSESGEWLTKGGCLDKEADLTTLACQSPKRGDKHALPSLHSGECFRSQSF